MDHKATWAKLKKHYKGFRQLKDGRGETIVIQDDEDDKCFLRLDEVGVYCTDWHAENAASQGVVLYTGEDALAFLGCFSLATN